MLQPYVLRLVTSTFPAAAPELIAEVPGVLGIQEALEDVLQDFVLHHGCSPSEAGAVKRGTRAASIHLLQRTLDRDKEMYDDHKGLTRLATGGADGFV